MNGIPIGRMKVFIAAILAVGAIRFALSVAGAPNGLVKYASMSAVISAGAVYVGVVCETWKNRLKAAYLLILPYMAIEALALGYSLATGSQTIFHAPEYSFGSTLPIHFAGHLIGGISWEPLFVFGVMQIVWLFLYIARSVFKSAR